MPRHDVPYRPLDAAAAGGAGKAALSDGRPRFYLVGEAERSHRAPAQAIAGRVSILINGRWHALRDKSLSFERLLRIVYPDRDPESYISATVAYRRGPSFAPEGIITRGDAIPVVEGLTINVGATFVS